MLRLLSEVATSRTLGSRAAIFDVVDSYFEASPRTWGALTFARSDFRLEVVKHPTTPPVTLYGRDTPGHRESPPIYAPQGVQLREALAWLDEEYGAPAAREHDRDRDVVPSVGDLLCVVDRNFFGLVRANRSRITASRLYEDGAGITLTFQSGEAVSLYLTSSAVRFREGELSPSRQIRFSEGEVEAVPLSRPAGIASPRLPWISRRAVLRGVSR